MYLFIGNLQSNSPSNYMRPKNKLVEKRFSSFFFKFLFVQWSHFILFFLGQNSFPKYSNSPISMRLTFVNSQSVKFPTERAIVYVLTHVLRFRLYFVPITQSGTCYRICVANIYAGATRCPFGCSKRKPRDILRQSKQSGKLASAIHTYFGKTYWTTHP